jgi:hypothetical protein
MQFEAREARSILLRQATEPIEVRYRGRVFCVVDTAKAAKMCESSEDLWGVGNDRRIRYLTIATTGIVAEGSRTAIGPPKRNDHKQHHMGRCQAWSTK